ncbi:MAG: sugar transferase [Candidatus Manganitrophus sp.]|nr:sugar transferase [Candidatus Manganitrophus sp.]MDC4223258.1 sugar transferase [Candidatus Manganitrophus sp.]WDT71640.1 MAG: sugar transferase [Candidatus Manganitrophus sp.]WDT81012.1 MAG: sugar transferase [Candidatus Manganitrophus sp.]
MLKQKAKFVAFAVYLTEIVLLLLAFLSAYWFRHLYLLEKYGPLNPFSNYLWLVNVILPLWSVLFYYFNLYESQRTKTFWKEAWKLTQISFCGTLLLMAIVFVAKADYISRFFIVLFGCLSFFFIFVERLILRTFLRAARKRGYNFRNILVVGTGRRAREVAEIISKNKQWGLKLIGFVSDNPEMKIGRVGKAPILGNIGDLPSMLQNNVVDELIFAVSRKRLEELEEIFLLCEEQGIRTRVAVNFFPHMIAKVHLEDLHGVPLLTFTTTPHDEVLLAAKRVFDLIIASVVLLALFPLSLLIASMIKLTSPGPVLFRQTRIGLNGRHFILYKFRSMLENAEGMRNDVEHLNEMKGPAFKILKDPRTTWVGRLLRRTSLDEFPQLYNVLRGDMSIVGPRPPLPEEVAKYERWQRRRLSMKPGLTCLWQINGRNKITDFKKWMELDLHYIDNWSLKLDLKIFIKTIFVVLAGRGAS